MKISNTMNLGDLAELMDDDSKSPARMCDFLVQYYNGEDTADIADADWDEMLEQAEPETEREYLNRVVRRLTPAEIIAQDAMLKALSVEERQNLIACFKRDFV